MNGLPNPFEFNSAVMPAMVAEPAAAPCLTDPAVAAAGTTFQSTQSSPPAASPATDVVPSASVATNSELTLSCDVRAGALAEINVGSDASPMQDGGTCEQRRALTNGDSLVLEPTLTGRGPCDSGATNSNDDTQYIPELFSVFAARRSMHIVNPPLPKRERNIDSIALGAVSQALNLHPRDLDEDPPPLCIRKPRPEFLRALFSLGGVR